MKIGIITYHRAKNLGAMLQSYALQKVVNKYLGECELIDYRNEKMEESYRVKKIKEIKGVKEKAKNILSSKKNKKFEIVRNQFNNNHQIISKKIYTDANINESNDTYDLFITGSDQVWNPKLNNEDENYFLKFVKNNKKRNSYAASFGVNDLEEKDKKRIKEELNKFNKISVREYEGKKIIEKLTDKESRVDLDPTLLLNKKEWNKILNEDRLEKEKYIFVYTIANTPTLIAFARKMAKEKKCKLLFFNSGYYRNFGMKNLDKVSPEDFLNYIKNAEYIITSSFHGLCFSINLNKEFYYELSEDKKNNNSRLTTLTKMLELENRRIINGECKIRKEIDYDIVNKKLDKQRKKSIEYICKLGE